MGPRDLGPLGGPEPPLTKSWLRHCSYVWCRANILEIGNCGGSATHFCGVTPHVIRSMTICWPWQWPGLNCKIESFGSWWVPLEAFCREYSACSATFPRVGCPPYFGLGRGPITPPGPAMLRANRKDLNSNKTKQEKSCGEKYDDIKICSEFILTKYVWWFNEWN